MEALNFNSTKRHQKQKKRNSLDKKKTELKGEKLLTIFVIKLEFPQTKEFEAHHYIVYISIKSIPMFHSSLSLLCYQDQFSSSKLWYVSFYSLPFSMNKLHVWHRTRYFCVKYQMQGFHRLVYENEIFTMFAQSLYVYNFC